MKLDKKGIRFNVWLYFFLFALGVIFIMGILQFTLIKPYYRNNKIKVVSQIADNIEEILLTEDIISEAALNRALQLNIENNVCSIIFNDKGGLIYSADSLGDSCILNHTVTSDDFSYIPSKSGEYLKNVLNENNGMYNLYVVNTKSQQEMIVYGKSIKSLLQTYYLFVNSPLEPVDSILAFFKNQYSIYTIIVTILSFVVSFYISNKLSRPIIKMRKSANLLSEANYNVTFEDSYFTETNELARTLNDATLKLSKVDELRKDLIANVSHDIKTPLTMIKAYAEMIKDISGDNKEKREEHLNVIINEVDYLDHLVNDMNQLSKMQSGNYELNCSNFDLSLKIKDIINLNIVSLNDANLKVILDIPDELIIYADEIKIGQVIYNFLSNAIKNTDANKKIYIKAFRIDDGIRVEVKDEGYGISEEDLPYIWDRYYKIDKQFIRKIESSGLGLAIVKAILVTHQARFGVESKVRKGSTFWFELDQENVL